MTSTISSASHPVSNASQTANAAASSSSGTNTSQHTARSYATAATKTSIPSPPIASSITPPVTGGPAAPHHAKSTSIPPMNGKNPILPAVPAMGGPTIVTSSNAVNGGPPHGDHSRKPSSVTISAAGTSGYMPNGGPVGPNSRPNISFGSMTAGGSPALANNAPYHSQTSSLSAPMGNPRVSSPANSPSPIPQPTASSGGRPPSTLQNQGNGLSFGSMGGDNAEQTMRAMPMGPGSMNSGPQATHLRRESSQSAHSDMSGAGMGNMNRGFPPGGRGRGAYPQGFAPPMGHSPATAFRQLPGQQRGASNMAPPYPAQGPMNQHPNSPYRATRSPALNPAVMQQQAHMANNPQMQHGSYGGYPQHLQPQQSMYGMPPQYEPAYAYYQPPYAMHPGMPYASNAPPSPRPYNPPHPSQQQYMQGHYGNVPHSQGMSRNSSQISERPTSSVGQPQTPAIASSSNHVGNAPNQSSGSPGPNSNFTIPAKTKSKGIVIKNADGEVVTFPKKSASPVPPTTRDPVVVSSTPTPPPRASSTSESAHSRSESKIIKTDAEKKHDFQEQVKKQAEAKLDEEERKAAKEKEEAAALLAKQKEEDDRKAAKEKEEAEKAQEQARKEAEAAEQAKKEAEEKARLEAEEAERLEREIAEMEELERQREEEERAYLEKKKKDAEQRAQKEAEAAAKADEEMKRAEREAEEREAARQQAKPEEDESSEAKAEREKLFASLKKPTFGPGANLGSESGNSTPGSDSMPPPPQPIHPKTASASKIRPAALKLEINRPVEPAQPTPGMQALKSARFLQVRNESVNYPDGFKSPNPALNHSGKRNGRQYDKVFLLQFQDVFKEKPSLDWDSKVKETVGDPGDTPSRPQGPRTPSIGAGRPVPRPSLPSGFAGPMGSFAQGGRTLPPGTTSHDRFIASSTGVRPPTMNNPLASFANRPGGFPVGAPPPMSRTNSLQTMNQGGPHSPRTGGSSRGKSSRRGGLDKAPSRREEEQAAKAMPLTAGQDLKPLEHSKSGWKPTVIGGSNVQVTPDGHLTPDMVQRKVKANLNKMTPEKFDKIADQILEIAAQSKDETDGRTLRQVIALTFEKACDEAHWASMYAKFCKRMGETMSPQIKDEHVKDKSGNPVVGGALFRKYLLNRCQEEFERGWEVNLPEKPEGQTEEAVMLSDEYYIAAAAKRRGLGLIQFIGELYKLGMLTLRIMHECVLKLLNFEGLPDESAIESLVKLLRTVGATMDSTDTGPKMIAMYFERIGKILEMPGLPSRLHFMLLDTVDLRRNRWRSKDDQKGPKTIQEIREEAAAAQQAELERQRVHQRGAGPRQQGGRNDGRSFSQGGMMPPPDYSRNQVGIDDLRKLSKGASGRNVNTGPVSFGPSMFGSRSSSGRKGLGPPGLAKGGDESGGSSRTGTPPVKDKESTTHANAFGALASLDGEEADDAAAPAPANKPKPSDAQNRGKSPSTEPGPSDQSQGRPGGES